MRLHNPFSQTPAAFNVKNIEQRDEISKLGIPFISDTVFGTNKNKIQLLAKKSRSAK